MTYEDFVTSLSDPTRISRLDLPQSEIITSFDRTGGNNDFNNYVGREGERWAVLADLEGPGYVTRFWTTGGDSAKQRLQFYFDGEKKPRIDATVEELSNGLVPFAAPLSRYEQSCWWTYVPLTFRKSLKILAETEGFSHQGWPRLFYQVNFSRLSSDRAVESFPNPFESGDLAALEKLGASWNPQLWPNIDNLTVHDHMAEIQPGDSSTVASLTGQGMIRKVVIGGRRKDVDDEKAFQNALSRLFVRMYWDEHEFPSVAVPLERLVGKVWDSPAPTSAYFDSNSDGLICRFPMPFARRARIEIENRNDQAVTIGIRLHVDESFLPQPTHGYFHSAWRHSGPDQRGKPHAVAQAVGRGKFVGCVLAVANADQTWWVLEGDETIRIDDETVPGWRGTGLEDYFNGAWYYKNNIVRPLHGLVFKRPFVTVQYRIHTDDARRFEKRIEVAFERGPDQGSRAWMDSVGYYYLETPAAANSNPWTGSEHDSPRDPFDIATLMSALANFERVNDHEGASLHIDRYLARHPNVGFRKIMELRQIAHEEAMHGIEHARPLYDAFINSEPDETAVSFAKLLLGFHNDPKNAFVSLFSGNPSRLFIDGQQVLQVSNPQAFTVMPIQLGPGEHTIAVEVIKKGYPDWVYVCVKTHGVLIGTDSSWLYAPDPEGDWAAAQFNDQTWGRVGPTIREGPPPVPYIGTSPHPFVGMQSSAIAVWVGKALPKGARSAVFRKSFTLE
jgi:hypothetical protein